MKHYLVRRIYRTTRCQQPPAMAPLTTKEVFVINEGAMCFDTFRLRDR